jgi:hypothetical protein
VNESSFSFAKGITKPENKSTKNRQTRVIFLSGKEKGLVA